MNARSTFPGKSPREVVLSSEECLHPFFLKRTAPGGRRKDTRAEGALAAPAENQAARNRHSGSAFDG